MQIAKFYNKNSIDISKLIAKISINRSKHSTIKTKSMIRQNKESINFSNKELKNGQVARNELTNKTKKFLKDVLA